MATSQTVEVDATHLHRMVSKLEALHSSGDVAVYPGDSKALNHAREQLGGDR